MNSSVLLKIYDFQQHIDQLKWPRESYSVDAAKYGIARIRPSVWQLQLDQAGKIKSRRLTGRWDYRNISNNGRWGARLFFLLDGDCCYQALEHDGRTKYNEFFIYVNAAGEKSTGDEEWIKTKLHKKNS